MTPNLEDKTSLFRCPVDPKGLEECTASLSKLAWPYVLLSGKTSCRLYNVQSGTCVFSHSADSEILDTALYADSFTLLNAGSFVTFSPDQERITMEDGRYRSGTLGASSGEEGSETTKVAITFSRGKTLSRKVRGRISTLDADSEQSSSFPETGGSFEILRSGSSVTPRSPSCGSLNFDSRSNFSADPSSEGERGLIYVHGIATTHELRFGELDSEENITYNAEKTIKTATFSKLVEKLTTANAVIDIDDFLLTYRAFSTPNDLLVSLLVRYGSASPEEEKAVRLRVINVLRTWLDKFRYDFEKEPENKTHLLKFLEATIAETPNSGALLSVKSKLENLPVQEEFSSTAAVVNPPPLLLPIHESEELGILEYPSLEIARQLTLIEWSMWAKIKPWELIGLAWTKAKKKELAPNVVAITEHFNRISSWISTEIVTTENAKTRVRVMRKFLQITQCLKTLGNYNGLMMFFSGFQRVPVNRLALTIKALRSESKANSEWMELEEICARDKNNANLRKAIQNSAPPLIPYPGMYLSDILFTDEGNKDIVKGQINYYKCQLISECIKKIKQYQLTGYNLTVHPPLEKLLREAQPLDEESMYTLSHYLEPRKGKEPGERPSLLDNYPEKRIDLKPSKVPLRRRDSVASGSTHDDLTESETTESPLSRSKSSKMLRKACSEISAPSPRARLSTMNIQRATAFKATHGNLSEMVGPFPLSAKNILVYTPAASTPTLEKAKSRKTFLVRKTSKIETTPVGKSSILVVAYAGEVCTYRIKSGKKIWGTCQDVPSSLTALMVCVGSLVVIAYEDKKLVIWKILQDFSLTVVSTIETNFVVSNVTVDGSVLYASGIIAGSVKEGVSTSFLVLNLSSLA
eukprot:TRINITY_DN5244_c0_g1_i2.p1 TRINITY_DN5244_c0_g1~~TRINITY_DN5244_c0_g1_i2.p1  ORF type:complete len:866 (+),score=149.55 TRINITY_DN5244_c0_g1_i2:1091-3688(+)